jgi:transcriptional regulator with XRE-family HTH domain
MTSIRPQTICNAPANSFIYEPKTQPYPAPSPLMIDANDVNPSIFQNTRGTISSTNYVLVKHTSSQRSTPTLLSRKKWRDREYRSGYVEAAIEQGVAWQIRANRTARKMTQSDLAALLNTQQSAISRLEDPSYGSASLETLISVAHAFDCALSVKFVPFSYLAQESADLSDDKLIVESYDREIAHLEPLNEG